MQLILYKYINQWAFIFDKDEPNINDNCDYCVRPYIFNSLYTDVGNDWHFAAKFSILMPVFLLTLDC